MSVQQCLACNAVVPKSSKTCECGHVFEDVKQIAGKRFSEYRAELYWRLENKRMEKLSKENTPCNGDQTVDQNNNADNYKSKEVGEKVVDKPAASIAAPAKVSKKSRLFQRRVEGLYPTKKKPAKTPYMKYSSLDDRRTVSTEEMRRFSKALEEINKKIHFQNLVWKLSS